MREKSERTIRPAKAVHDDERRVRAAARHGTCVDVRESRKFVLAVGHDGVHRESLETGRARSIVYIIAPNARRSGLVGDRMPDME